MLQLDCHRRYADVLELALYNAVLSGGSSDGTRFFYDNPLASGGSHHREEWFGCPCCPPNLARIIAALGSYIYTQTEDEAVVHLYMQSAAQLRLGRQTVSLRQETNYPWDGAVTIRVGVNVPATFGLRLRLPGWCSAPRMTVNDEAVDLAGTLEGGYAHIRRTWQDGDAVALELPMPAERVYAHPDVRADVANTALRRGPLVYCLEQMDHDVPLHRMLLPAQAELTARFEPELLGGVVVLEGHGLSLSDAGWDDTLYRTMPPEAQACAICAIPYYTWDNRAAGPMTVWVHEQTNAPDSAVG